MSYTQPTTFNEALEEVTPILHKLARRFTRNHYQDYQDIFNEGVIGVLKAWDNYDTDYGYKFSTYAYMKIFHEMKQYAIRSWSYKNNTATMVEGFNEGEYYLDETGISLERELQKKDKQFQTIFKMRNEGYTYQETAEELGLKSLHEARNIYMEGVQDIESV